MEAVNLASLDYNQYVMQEVGRTIADDPQKLIDLLESNDFEVDPSVTPVELGDAYLYELPYSDGLKLGTAYLIEKQNSSFSGEVDNENIYDIFDAISDYWEEGEDEEPKSNIVAGLVGGIIQGGLNVTDKVLEGKNKKKYGALDLATKQANSRQALISGIIAQKQAQALAEQKKAELEAKKKKTTTIAVASVVGVLLIIGTIIYIKKQKNG
jgi:hypothetical protein